MAESELHRKGEAIGKLRGDADFARNKSEYDKDPVMKKFINVATKTVFGALWAAGLDFNHLADREKCWACRRCRRATAVQVLLQDAAHQAPRKLHGRSCSHPPRTSTCHWPNLARVRRARFEGSVPAAQPMLLTGRPLRVGPSLFWLMAMSGPCQGHVRAVSWRPARWSVRLE